MIGIGNESMVDMVITDSIVTLHVFMIWTVWSSGHHAVLCHNAVLRHHAKLGLGLGLKMKFGLKYS